MFRNYITLFLLPLIKTKIFLSVILTSCVDDIISVLLELDDGIFKYSSNSLELDNSSKKYSVKFLDILTVPAAKFLSQS